MQAVTQASASRLRLDWRNMPVAIIVSRRRIIEDAYRRDDRSVHLELDYLVTVFCFPSISVVHCFPFVLNAARVLTLHARSHECVALRIPCGKVLLRIFNQLFRLTHR